MSVQAAAVWVILRIAAVAASMICSAWIAPIVSVMFGVIVGGGAAAVSVSD